MFSFQGTPGGSLNPKEFWVENCNTNERFLWLNKQDVEPLWLSVEEVPGYPGTRSNDDAQRIVTWCWEMARSRWHYIWVDRNFDQPDREEIIFTAEHINSQLLTLSFNRKAEIDALIADNDALSVDKRMLSIYIVFLISLRSTYGMQAYLSAPPRSVTSYECEVSQLMSYTQVGC